MNLFHLPCPQPQAHTRCGTPPQTPKGPKVGSEQGNVSENGSVTNTSVNGASIIQVKTFSPLERRRTCKRQPNAHGPNTATITKASAVTLWTRTVGDAKFTASSRTVWIKPLTHKRSACGICLADCPEVLASHGRTCVRSGLGGRQDNKQMLENQTDEQDSWLERSDMFKCPPQAKNLTTVSKGSPGTG